MKDVLVDNNIAKNFCNPLDEEYKKFIRWLFEEGALVITSRLIREYTLSTGSSPSGTNIVVIVNRLQSQGRLNRIGRDGLQRLCIRKHVVRRLRSNRSDHELIKAVMLSVRKYALSRDRNFRHDVNNFPGYAARAEARPQDLPYAD